MCPAGYHVSDRGMDRRDTADRRSRHSSSTPCQATIIQSLRDVSDFAAKRLHIIAQGFSPGLCVVRIRPP